MKDTSANTALEEFYVGQEEVTTHQEAVPLPVVIGTRKIAVRWIGEAVDMVLVEAPDEAPGKK